MHRRSRVTTNNRRPATNSPTCNDTFDHIRVGGREALYDIRRVTLKQQRRPIHRISKRPAQNQFASRMRCPGRAQMRPSIGSATLGRVRPKFVKKQEMHNSPNRLSRDSGGASLHAWPDEFDANSSGFETHHMLSRPLPNQFRHELDRNFTLPFQLIGQLR